jgi:hypothetical protein
VGKTTVDENIVCVACRCVGVLGGVCLCGVGCVCVGWGVFVLGSSGITYWCVVRCPVVKRNVKIAGFLFKNLYTPEDGHQMAETCSLSSIE